MKTDTYFIVETSPGHGFMAYGKSHWETEEEATMLATEFKNNPRCHNPNMTDENVAYWQSKNYTVIGVVKTTVNIRTI